VADPLILPEGIHRFFGHNINPEDGHPFAGIGLLDLGQRLSLRYAIGTTGDGEEDDGFAPQTRRDILLPVDGG